MPTTTLEIAKEYEHLGETRGIADHDHDLVHELSRRLDCLWRYDQYIANAGNQAELENFWRNAKVQEQTQIEQLKKLIKQHIQKNCF
jgi:capsule polysaccharide modification protein KpsS